MQEKILFRELLQEIKIEAEKSGGQVSAEVIKARLKDAKLNEEQLTMVYDYLIQQKIQVSGYEPRQEPEAKAEGSDLTPDRKTEEQSLMAEQSDQAETSGQVKPVSDEEQHLLAMYREEIANIRELEDAEVLELYRAVLAGNDQAKPRLIEGFLPAVPRLAADYTGKGISINDLIQEGNIGLIETVERLGKGSGESRMHAEACRRIIENGIRRVLQDAVDEHQNLQESARQIAQRLNHLSQAAENLEADLEHKPSIEELSAYLEMPETEIKDLLRMAGDEIEVENHPKV